MTAGNWTPVLEEQQLALSLLRIVSLVSDFFFFFFSTQKTAVEFPLTPCTEEWAQGLAGIC